MTSEEISKEVYDNWLKTADKVEDEYCSFSSWGGPHEFVRQIEKDGMLYELSLGSGWQEDKSKIDYRIKCLHKVGGQDGDSI